MGDDGRDIQSSDADKDQYGLFFTTCLDDEKNVEKTQRGRKTKS